MLVPLDDLMAMITGAQPSLTGIGVAALADPDLQLQIGMTVRMPNWLAP